MSNASHFRKTAELCRRIASIPTTGGHRADRALLALAGKLDHEIAALDARDLGESQTDAATSQVRPRAPSNRSG